MRTSTMVWDWRDLVDERLIEEIMECVLEYFQGKEKNGPRRFVEPVTEPVNDVDRIVHQFVRVLRQDKKTDDRFYCPLVALSLVDEKIEDPVKWMDIWERFSWRMELETQLWLYHKE